LLFISLLNLSNLVVAMAFSSKYFLFNSLITEVSSGLNLSLNC